MGSLSSLRKVENFLWNYIDILFEEKHKTHAFLQFLSMRLTQNRSRQMPPDLTVSFTGLHLQSELNFNTQNPAIQPLAEHAERWRVSIFTYPLQCSWLSNRSKGVSATHRSGNYNTQCGHLIRTQVAQTRDFAMECIQVFAVSCDDLIL